MVSERAHAFQHPHRTRRQSPRRTYTPIGATPLLQNRSPESEPDAFEMLRTYVCASTRFVRILFHY